MRELAVRFAAKEARSTALGVGLSRWLPATALLAAWPALYIFRPDAIRELHFHRLFPADPLWWTALGGILLLPVLGALPADPRSDRRNVAFALTLAAAAAIVFAWLSPEQAPPYVQWR